VARLSSARLNSPIHIPNLLALLVQKIMLGYHMSKDTAIVMKLTRLVCRQQEKGKCYSSVIHGKYSSL